MSRYIDADLLEVDLWDSPNAWRDDEMGFSREQVDNLPTADVRKVKHGHWTDTYIEDNIEYGYCSMCSAYVMVDNYCSYCGAKMDEVIE